MGNLAKATAAPRTVQAGGEEFEVRPLRMGPLGKIQEWLAARPKPDFMGEARKLAVGLEPALARPLIEEAAARERSWPPDLIFDSSAAMSIIMGSREGRVEILYQAIGQDRADFDRARASEVLDGMTLREFTAIMDAALGLRDGPDDGGPKDQ